MAVTRVVVLGAAGRMGTAVCAAVAGDPTLALAAVVDPAFAAAAPAADADPAASRAARTALRERRAPRLDELDAAGIDVAVDFTTASAVPATAAWCARNGVHLVTGTTGLDAGGLAALAAGFPAGGPANCIRAANFAVSAVLMLRFAELAAPFFDGAEVIELHHGSKRDAPSGTALETARRIARARLQSGAGAFAPDPTADLLPGARGASGGEAEVPVQVHSVRLNGLVAHQEVIFGAAGQSLTIRQDSYDRASFMPGVLLAVRQVAGRPGFTDGLEALLGLG